MEITNGLNWLISAIGAGAVTSFLFENIAWFKQFTGEVKKWLFFVSASFVAISAYLLLVYVPVEFWKTLEPFYAIIASIFVSVFSGNIWHKVVNRNR